MNCQEAQERILESLDEPLTSERRQAMENHIATCRTCERFAGMQRMLDTRLAAFVPAAQLSPHFRTSVREGMRKDSVSAWPDFLPELAHLIGCACVILLALFLLPRPGTVILLGVAFTGATYFLQSALRSSLEGLDGDA